MISPEDCARVNVSMRGVVFVREAKRSLLVQTLALEAFCVQRSLITSLDNCSR